MKREFALGIAGAVFVVACASGCPDPDPRVTAVTVGITTDLRPGVDLSSVIAEKWVNGTALESETLSGEGLTFPAEVRFDALEADDEVKIVLSGRSGGDVVVTRSASTTAIEGRHLLLPVSLDAACAGQAAPDCSEDLTCAKGACVDPAVLSADLANYTASWSDEPNDDVCKRTGDEPVITVGQGQGNYLAAEEGAVAQVEAGPQGGYHIWISARMQGLSRSGSVTMVRGEIPSLDYAVPPYSVVFSFEPDEGDHCKIFGLRLRVDDDTHGVESLLGREIDVTVEITDKDGVTGEGHRRLRLSSDFI